jgi:pyruvate/2-oxoglutarate dehydrogenase complex dihydrolipoamide dehydrogenase (E3) component
LWASALIIPWCTYTDPEIVHVGLYEQEAKERGIACRTFTQVLAEVDRAIVDGEEEGFAKVLVSLKGDNILGATLVAAHAGDMVSELTLAMVGGLGLRTIARTIHPYPTQRRPSKRSAMPTTAPVSPRRSNGCSGNGRRGHADPESGQKA